MEFSEKIQTFLKEEYNNADVDAMSLDELKQFLVDVSQKREEYAARELAYKLSGNAAYGASANPAFPFFNVNLAADITGECRELTKFMWNRLERFFHEDIWERKDLWKQFDFELDESKKKWYSQQAVSVYSDTDSCVRVSNLDLKTQNGNIKKSIGDLFKEEAYKSDPIITEDGHEILMPNDIKVKNYTKENGLYYAPIKRIIRHKVSKPKFKITSKSGKEIIVTGDHSCIVFRDGQQLTIKAKDINKETDKILTVVSE